MGEFDTICPPLAQRTAAQADTCAAFVGGVIEGMLSLPMASENAQCFAVLRVVSEYTVMDWLEKARTPPAPPLEDG